MEIHNRIKIMKGGKKNSGVYFKLFNEILRVAQYNVNEHFVL